MTAQPAESLPSLPRRSLEAIDPQSEYAAVHAAAELLADRAQRFLGYNWCIVRWAPPRMAPYAG